MTEMDSQTSSSIELHVDLTVDPAKQRELLDTFHNVFRPAASKQPGYIDVKLLKFRASFAGEPPSGSNYRFVLHFESEELRQKWIATPVHQEVWPAIAKTLVHENYTIFLYDAA